MEIVGYCAIRRSSRGRSCYIHPENPALPLVMKEALNCTLCPHVHESIVFNCAGDSSILSLFQGLIGFLSGGQTRVRPIWNDKKTLVISRRNENSAYTLLVRNASTNSQGENCGLGAILWPMTPTGTPAGSHLMVDKSASPSRNRIRIRACFARGRASCACSRWPVVPMSRVVVVSRAHCLPRSCRRAARLGAKMAVVSCGMSRGFRGLRVARNPPWPSRSRLKHRSSRSSHPYGA